MRSNDFIQRFENHPKQLFLIDGIGAIISSFLLGVVLVRFEVHFGIPASTLYVLATLPALFAIYDLFCFQKEINNLGIYLKAIAVINVFYCCLSIGCVFYHIERVTSLGWIYILFEVFIVLILARYENKVANRLIKKF